MKWRVYAGLPGARRMIGLMIAATLTAHAQLTNFHRLHSFGDASKMGTKPAAGLIVGSDGFLYGTTSEGGLGGQGVVFKVRPDGSGYSVLHHFSGGTGDGASPVAELLEASDGALYGTTSSGGPSFVGTVFKVNKDGSGYSVLHYFGATGDGRVPMSALIEGSDHKLYGTTRIGGTADIGTVFRINKDGTGYGLVHDFASGNEGGYVYASLVEGADGSLYGVTAGGGITAPVRGTLFKVNKDGSGFAVLRNFQGQPNEPARVVGLIAGPNGVLYGVSGGGGSTNLGCVFSVSTDGQNLTVLRNFTGDPDARVAVKSLIEGQDGALYGTTVYGGTNGIGTVFRINRDGSDFALLHQFQQGGTGYSPQCKLAQGPSGELFGTTILGGPQGTGIIFSLQTNGAGYRPIWRFLHGGGEPQTPHAPLVEGPDGLLYGTGSSGGQGGWAGAIFRIRKDGSGYATLRHFGLTPGDGSGLYSGVIVGRDGKLYGASENGGNDGWGIVYKMDRDGTGYQILHHFRYGVDGRFPYATLLQASDGFLYGATRAMAGGTIFKVSTNGTGFATLRFLTPPTDGADLGFPLIEASDGFLYGTTLGGGSGGGGTIFRIGRDGSNFTVLRHLVTFSGEGYEILAGLLEGSDGVLYGTTASGGLQKGTAFKIDKNGTGYQVLHHFTSADRALWPFGGLVEGHDGALYGSAFVGATHEYGAVYKLNKDGSGFMLLHEFSGPDGNSPGAPLLIASDGAFYGTATAGGDLGLGTLFRIGHHLSLQKTSSAVHLELTGVPGYTYTVRRSANLRDWSSWMTLDKMPASARLFFSDTAPPDPAGFYVVANEQQK